MLAAGPHLEAPGWTKVGVPGEEIARSCTK
jgi:hypothetical protein